jgi:hypothetical protein
MILEGCLGADYANHSENVSALTQITRCEWMERLLCMASSWSEAMSSVNCSIFDSFSGGVLVWLPSIINTSSLTLYRTVLFH